MVSASNISAPASAVDEPAIRTIALTRRFGRVHALRGVDLHVPRGSITGFIGNNGAGKTTTIHALLGFIPPTSGRAFVLGFDSQTRGIQIRRRVGFFPERDHPYEWMRLRMLFEMGAAAYETWDRDLCARLCAQFELDPKRRIRELSKGMAAKAKLVFALAHRPECLILDEPTSGLDPASRYELLCLIRRLTVERNATALFSSHILDDVAGIATDLVLIHEGRIVLAESMATVRDDLAVVEVRDGPPEPPADLCGMLIASVRRADALFCLVRGRSNGRLEALARANAGRWLVRCPSLMAVLVFLTRGWVEGLSREAVRG